MSIAEFSKDHGRSILGAGLFALAASIGYVGHGVFQRFDEVKSLSGTMVETTQRVETMVGEVKGVQAQIKTDLTTLRAQFPALGAEAGQAASTAVEVFKETQQAGCTTAATCGAKVLRDAIRNRQQQPKP